MSQYLPEQFYPEDRVWQVIVGRVTQTGITPQSQEVAERAGVSRHMAEEIMWNLVEMGWLKLRGFRYLLERP